MKIMVTNLKRSMHVLLKKKKKVKSLSRVQLFETPWTVAYQAPTSMGFSRQEYWSGLSFPSPMHCYTQCQSCSRSSLTHASTRGSQTHKGKSGQSPAESVLLSSGSWCTRFCCALQESISQAV